MPEPKPPREDDWETTGVSTQRPAQQEPPASARKALALIGELRKDFDRFEGRQYERDQLMMAKFDEHASEDRALFNKISDTMANVQVQNATQSVELREIRHELKNQKQALVLKQTLDTEVKATQEKTDIEDTAHRKKFKREIALKMISILGPIFAALGGAVALLLRSC